LGPKAAAESSEENEGESGFHNGVNVHRRKRAENGQEEEEENKGESLAEDDDEFDHDNFMEKMLNDMHNQQDDDETTAKELEDQIQKEAEAARAVEEKKAEFADNNFWKADVGEQYDIDDLMKDMAE
jgi:hypothetical protein